MTRLVSVKKLRAESIDAQRRRCFGDFGKLSGYYQRGQVLYLLSSKLIPAGAETETTAITETRSARRCETQSGTPRRSESTNRL